MATRKKASKSASKATEPSERVRTLRKRVRQLDEQLRRAEAKDKTDERKRDTRRKILLGALVLDLMERDPKWKKSMRQRLSRKLTRPHDRALFDLPPLPDKDGKNAAK